MIHRLRGQLVEKDGAGVVVEAAGVGYRAATSASTLQALPSLGEECVLHTRLVVREDAMLLFGFATSEERAAFDALTAVSKVGPKLALAVLSTLSPPELSEAVARGDAVKLATVPGLGNKTAERLIVELKGKDIPILAETSGARDVTTGPGAYMEAREALAGLGYSLEEAEKALNEVPSQDSVEGYVRQALRRMGSRR